MKSKSAESADFEKGNTLDRVSYGKMLKKKNEEISASERGNTLNRVSYEKMLKKKNAEVSGSLKGNTMDRVSYKKMLKKKNEVIAASAKGNTLGRKEHTAMMRSKSEKIADFEKGLVLTRDEKIKVMKKKSKAIDNYQAGYLNTAAERKARIRSFFFPGQYQANTPTEKLKKMRSTSAKIARFEGKIKERQYVRTMHPSARHLGKFSLASMDDRQSFRERTARQLSRDKRAYLPVYLKNKPPKPRYNKNVEKGLWAD
jgi:hypothetical protein